MKKILLIVIATVLVLASSTPAHAYNADQLHKARNGEKNCAGFDLSSAGLNGNFSGVDFSGADLRNIKVSNVSNLTGANFTGAKLERAKFYRVKLTNANFTEADLSSHARIGLDGLDGTDLSQADLSGAAFRNALVCDVHLERANLNHATFSVPTSAAHAFCRPL